MPSHTLCSDQTLITSVAECKQAAQMLNIPFGESGEWRAPFDFTGCLVSRDRNLVYCNTATDLIRAPDSIPTDYHAICRSEIKKGQYIFNVLFLLVLWVNLLVRRLTSMIC